MLEPYLYGYWKNISQDVFLYGVIINVIHSPTASFVLTSKHRAGVFPSVLCLFPVATEFRFSHSVHLIYKIEDKPYFLSDKQSQSFRGIVQNMQHFKPLANTPSSTIRLPWFQSIGELSRFWSPVSSSTWAPSSSGAKLFGQSFTFTGWTKSSFKFHTFYRNNNYNSSNSVNMALFSKKIMTSI
jgi:hypothetical protein